MTDNSKGRTAINSWGISLIDDIKSPQRNSIAMGPFGSNIKKENFQAEGIPVIRGNNLKNSKFVDCDFVYISDNLANQLSASLTRRLDIILTHRGTIGQVAIIPPDSKFNTYIVSQSQMKVTLDQTKCDPYFVYYFLRTEFGLSQFLSNSSQTGVPAIASPTSTLKSIKIPLPPLNEQMAIAKILSDLDSKIELNQKINKTLEAIAQAIFKRWFIDFEFPNEEGKPYKSSGGEMVDSELGKIPKDWKLTNFTKEFVVNMGQSPPGKSYNIEERGEPFFQGRKDFGERFPSIRVYCNDPKKFASKGETLISVRAPVGDINKALVDCCIGRGLASVKHASSSLSYTYYTMVYMKSRLKDFESKGTVFGSISKSDFRQLNVIAPRTSIIQEFEKIIGAFDEMIELNTIQNRTLEAARDSLLPKLISGKIRVPLEE